MKVIETLVTFCGETHYAGLPCALIRFSGCPLRCSWCDTAYAYTGGREISPSALHAWIQQTGMHLVLLTGGEPLIQEQLPAFAQTLSVTHTVLVETSGAFDISCIPPPIVRSVDVKCPGSGEDSKNDWSNMALLAPGDAVKFVISSREDYDYAVQIVKRYSLKSPVEVLFSPTSTFTSAGLLARWILEDRLSVRLNLQMHKLAWPDLEA